MSQVVVNPYRYADSEPVVSWEQFLNNTQNQISKAPSSETQKFGQTITNSSYIVGTELVKITFRLRNTFSAAGSYQIYCRVWDSAGNVRTTSETEVYLNELQQGLVWSDPADRVTFTFDSPVVFAQDDIVGIEPDGGTFNVSSIVSLASNSGSPANTNCIDYRNGSWGTMDFSSWDLWLIAYEPA